MNPERRALNKVAKIYKESNLNQFRTYCAATWFFWANDLNPYDDSRFLRRMFQDSLEQAPPGSVAIWETHYANRLGNNVSQNFFFRRSTQWVELFRQESSDHKNVAILYQKYTGNNLSEYVNNFVSSVPDYAPAYVARGNLYLNAGRVNEAIADFNKSRQLEPENSYLYYSLGQMYFNSADYALAIQQYDYLIEKDQYKPQALYQRARSKQGLGNTDGACADLQTAISLKLPEAQTLFEQWCTSK